MLRTHRQNREGCQPAAALSVSCLVAVRLSFTHSLARPLIRSSPVYRPLRSASNCLPARSLFTFAFAPSSSRCRRCCCSRLCCRNISYSFCTYIYLHLLFFIIFVFARFFFPPFHSSFVNVSPCSNLLERTGTRDSEQPCPSARENIFLTTANFAAASRRQRFPAVDPRCSARTASIL